MNIEDIIKNAVPFIRTEFTYTNLRWIRSFTVDELLWASIQPDWRLSPYGLRAVDGLRSGNISREQQESFGVAFTPDKDTELLIRLCL